jgi:hypothetical protein
VNLYFSQRGSSTRRQHPTCIGIKNPARVINFLVLSSLAFAKCPVEHGGANLNLNGERKTGLVNSLRFSIFPFVIFLFAAQAVKASSKSKVERREQSRELKNNKGCNINTQQGTKARVNLN